MTDIYLGSEATINLTAYPDTVFRAAVSEISDAETDSSGNVTYDVTVTITGDVSGLFQGMTGDITFISEETADVLYVSRRALITEGDNTYVKVRDEKGKVKKIQVTTGFTDGTYTEITGGLSEGDTVLIESKVN
jgi:HlyD family secretion protein